MERQARGKAALGIAAVFASFCLLNAARAGEPAPEAKAGGAISECRWTDEEIKIDGAGDDAAWKLAQVVDNFHLPWLKANARPGRNKTTARLLWDREYVYFLAEMEDNDLYAGITDQDGPAWNDDTFELFFKPAADKPGYYEFEVNAANTKLDMFLPRRNTGGYDRFKKDRTFDWKTEVKLRGTLNKWQDKDTGWTVEGRIPWRDFLPTGGRPADNEVWTFALCRVNVSVDFEGVDLSTTAPLKTLNYADFHRYEEYSPLKFVGPRKDAAVKPFGLPQRIAWNDSRLNGTPEPPPPFTVKKAFDNLTLPCPIHVYHEPGTSNLLLLNQTHIWTGKGSILRVKDDPAATNYEALLTPDRIFYGLAFHPQFEKNGYVFAGSNGPLSSSPKTTRVSRFTISRTAPYHIDPKSEVVIIEWESDGHNGGDLGFGPDGMLYITSGDGTSDSDTNHAGQDLSKLTSKMLRIDVEKPAPGKNYSVPPDNPFVKDEGVRPETWAYGLRNPWRMCFDKETGHLWVGNNGQDLWEQVYFIRKGENYGWSVMEGGHDFYPNRKRGPHPIVKPLIDHPHSEARSLTGGQVYYGKQFPELRGMYIYGDYSTGTIWGLKYDGQKIEKHLELVRSTLRITGFGFDSKGELLIADFGGSFYKLERAQIAAGAKEFPRKLSETGLFASVKDHKPHPALIPYSVNSPLWSDGSYKERFIALPGADSQIGFNSHTGWDFPDGSVLVKSFALEKEHGNAASRQWVETRLMVKYTGQWIGYSYQWNEDQSDAVLVKAEGADRDYSIRDASAPIGVRRQPWHYPSRTECMVCHSRASNFVLGLSELQMNRNHDYGAVVDNQIRALENIGVLSVKWMDYERAAIKRDAKNKGMSNKEADEFTEKLCATQMQREPRASTLLHRKPETLKKLVDPYDAAADLNTRARSYLHANCAHCHINAGGGNAMIELDFPRGMDSMNILDAKPLHHTFDKPDAKIVASGSPERSVLLHRISMRGAGQMPPLASVIVDEPAVKLIREWISKLEPLKPKEPAK
jgi:uncharacterized repeat protein (TIGR03806 family)